LPVVGVEAVIVVAEKPSEFDRIIELSNKYVIMQHINAVVINFKP